MPENATEAKVGSRDMLTLTLRLHDPKEKQDLKLSASWVTLEIPREDLNLSAPDFAAKHLLPAVEQLEHFKPRSA